MQRTVKGKRIQYVEINENNDGTVDTVNVTVTIPEADEKKARKRLAKMLGYTPYVKKVEPFECLYVLDDEIFFKYAVPVNPEDAYPETK